MNCLLDAIFERFPDLRKEVPEYRQEIYDLIKNHYDLSSKIGIFATADPTLFRVRFKIIETT